MGDDAADDGQSHRPEGRDDGRRRVDDVKGRVGIRDAKQPHREDGKLGSEQQGDATTGCRAGRELGWNLHEVLLFDDEFHQEERDDGELEERHRNHRSP